jgi:hypothetical protein
MQRSDLSLLTVLGALATFVAAQTVSRPHRTESVSSGAVSSAPTRELESHAGDRRGSRAAVATAELPAEIRAMNRTDVRRQLEAGADGTYIGELLLDRDSALTRWPDRIARPLKVWISRGGRIEGWKEQYVNEVADAFNTWEGVGIPVRFALAPDSASADVHVVWTDRFREPISGKTIWSRDDRWWIVDADITLALHHKDGEALDAAQVRAIALHEIGHLLGLDHTGDQTNVMAARVRVRDLSAADRATVRLLYSVPAGKITE